MKITALLLILMASSVGFSSDKVCDKLHHLNHGGYLLGGKLKKHYYDGGWQVVALTKEVDTKLAAAPEGIEICIMGNHTEYYSVGSEIDTIFALEIAVSAGQ